MISLSTTLTDTLVMHQIAWVAFLTRLTNLEVLTQTVDTWVSSAVRRLGTS